MSPALSRAAGLRFSCHPALARSISRFGVKARSRRAVVGDLGAICVLDEATAHGAGSVASR